ncbi:SDR family oxidoreductase [Microcoleus sp. bin38.metabat.b11b12b14.051]|uniref:SDR family NAD(P)-dependent oxidoreductase n=1 Tax=Microcoleus sp. bin38.metabat.b11b12b14.051 TaxID=2742709 RepID=UPI0025DF8FF7|nr:SDR family oxidoreductase [Microcoleus sp. bin38.metabat.b11b12b14.051]
MPTALITGASGGIGAAFAVELAKRQHNLILVARSEAKMQQLAAQLQQEFKVLVEIIVQDLTAPGATTAVFDAVVQKGWTVDLLVNNAGFGDYGAFADRPLAKQVEIIQLNIVALVELSHLFLSGMRERRSGSIINVASIAAFQPMPYLSIYAATKAFVLSFSEALWAENKDLGIRVLAVCAGPTESDFFTAAEFPPGLASSSGQKLVSADEVVRDALKALDKKQSNVVTGGFLNKIIVNMPRFMPRQLLVNSVAKLFMSKG